MVGSVEGPSTLKDLEGVDLQFRNLFFYLFP